MSLTRAPAGTDPVTHWLRENAETKARQAKFEADWLANYAAEKPKEPTMNNRLSDEDRADIAEMLRTLVWVFCIGVGSAAVIGIAWAVLS